jgi:hypothetical protein
LMILHPFSFGAAVSSGADVWRYSERQGRETRGPFLRCAPVRMTSVLL